MEPSQLPLFISIRHWSIVYYALKHHALCIMHQALSIMHHTLLKSFGLESEEVGSKSKSWAIAPFYFLSHYFNLLVSFSQFLASPRTYRDAKKYDLWSLQFWLEWGTVRGRRWRSSMINCQGEGLMILGNKDKEILQIHTNSVIRIIRRTQK